MTTDRHRVSRRARWHLAGVLLPWLAAGAAAAAEVSPPERNPYRNLGPAVVAVETSPLRVPLPERRPARNWQVRKPADTATAQAEAAEPQASWSEADIAAAKAECLALTEGLAVDLRYLAPIRLGQCGAAQPVELRSLGSGQKVTLVPPAIMNCRMVAMLTRWLDTSVQPRAKALLGKPIARLTNASAYVCRNRYNAKDQKLSEHARANALDISGFVTTDGRSIDVASFWGPTMAEIEAREAAEAERTAKAAQTEATTTALPSAPESSPSAWVANTAEQAGGPVPPLPVQAQGKGKSKPAKHAKPIGLGTLVKGEPLIAAGSATDRKRKRGVLIARPAEHAPKTAEGKFLQAVHAEACATFGTVLGPEANAAHRDHFHLDLAARRNTNFCQ